MSRRTPRPIALAWIVALGLAACGGEESVGDESVLQFDQDDSAAFGATTTAPTETTLLTATTVPPGVEAEVTTTTTAAAQEATTTLPPEQQEVSVEVRILDNSPYFDPSRSAVPVGGKIRFVNAGNATFNIVSDTGAFDSGPIAPGAVWIFDANTPGTFNYSDGTRPYAVGSFQVVA